MFQKSLTIMLINFKVAETSIFDACESASVSTSKQIRQRAQDSDSHSSHSDDDRKKKKKHEKKKKSRKSKKNHRERSPSNHSASSNRSSDGGRKKKRRRHKRHNNDEDEDDIENSAVGTKRIRNSDGKAEITNVRINL